MKRAPPSIRTLITLVEDASLRARDPRANPRFLAWFRDSKVVDEDGKPLVLYHGTAREFSSFRGMVWGSVSPRLAGEYAAMRDHERGAGGNIIPIYMRIERPFDADLGLSKTVKIGEFFNEVIEQGAAHGTSLTDALRAEVSELLDTLRQAARREESGPHYARHDFWFDAASMFGRDGAEAIRRIFDLFGFDGVRMIEEGELTFGAFAPEQVKSAFNARFDPGTPHLSEIARRRPPA